jgi:hypothetical protein
MRTLALSSVVVLSVACGRLGFSEHVFDQAHGDPREHPRGRDAGSSPWLDDAGAHPSSNVPDAAPLPAHDSGTGTPDAALGRDAALGSPFSLDDAGPPDAGPPPPAVDPACNASFPTRLWPVASDVQSCTDSVGTTRSTTGPDSADYTVYEGCSTWLEFKATPSSTIQVRAFGDGCVCPECSLWHVHYELEENRGAGLRSELEVQLPDDTQCPGGIEVDSYTSFTPSTTRVRLQTLAGTTGSGFYFVVCGAP